MINLTMGVFSVFAYLMATRNCVQRFVNEAACWHETVSAKGHLVSPSVSAPAADVPSRQQGQDVFGLQPDRTGAGGDHISKLVLWAWFVEEGP